MYNSCNARETTIMNESKALQPVSAVQITHLDEMVGGWFIGAFTPAAYSTNDVEVAVKHFPAGVVEKAHVHWIATEITLLLQGRARMADRELKAGDIITLAPGTASAFEALEACITVVIKHPGALNDKYFKS